MRATGIVRKVDQLGRVSIPKEIRKSLQIENKDPVEIFTDGEYIIFQKYNPGCFICGEVETTRIFKKKLLCQKCIDAINA